MNLTSFYLIIVAGLWGGSNPLIKRYSRGVEKIKKPNGIQQTFSELGFLFTNWKYVLSFLLNQAGSVLYYLTLASADISYAVPITNSLTFLFTLLSGFMMKEEVLSYDIYIGMVLVLLGVLICVS